METVRALRTDVDGGVLVMTIDRPHVRNAIDADVFAGLDEAFCRLDTDEDLRVGVLTGAGGYFSAGMDIAAFARGESMGAAKDILRGRRPAKPLVAAVEGFAVGGGLELALVCDLLVAAEDARFGCPEVKRGIIAAGGGLVRLTQRIGYHHAMELTLTGRLIDAQRAAEIGLVSQVVGAGHALDAATRLAAEIASNAPLAVQATKRMVRASTVRDEDDLWSLQEDVLPAVLASHDASEGAAAFLDKREPRWTGR